MNRSKTPWTEQASIGALRNQARLIERALKAGDQETLQGIEAAVRPLSNEEVRAQNLQRYLTARDVNVHTALVKESELASTSIQRRHQSAGAADALNSFVASFTNEAILHPDIVHEIGVENAARVAAHLRGQRRLR